MINAFDKIKEIYPQSLTILPTYRCNAECTECCFESNPRITQRITLQSIIKAIDEAKKNFPPLQLIVFSGGEVFLLKDDLYAAISHARSLGLQVRCVTNAFWGRSERIAKQTVDKLLSAGVSEVNISTGADHQKFIPFESVETACSCLVHAGIRTLITVEKDSPETNCLERARLSQKLRPLLIEHPRLFSIQCNSWMPFHKEYVERGPAPGLKALRDGCSQIFTNIVVTPYGKVAACCGLTFEHIPEMTIGDLSQDGLSGSFDMAISDFLKIWIHLDGPGNILRQLFGEEIDDELSEIRHICQACAVMHLHPKIKKEIEARYLDFLPDVLARFTLKIEMRRAEAKDTENVVRFTSKNNMEVVL